MADNQETPDLQSAGVVAPQEDPQSILRALSMGMSPQAQHPLAGPGAILAGFGAGFRGQANPVVAQMQQQQQIDLASRAQTMNLLTQAQRMREAKQGEYRQLYQTLAGMNDPEIRTYGVRGLIKMSRAGGNTDPGLDIIGKELIYGNMSREQMEGAVKLAHGAVVAKQPPQEISLLLRSAYPDVKPETLAALMSQAGNKQFARDFGLKSPEELDIEAGKNRVEYELKLRELAKEPDPKYPPAHIHFDQKVEQYNNLARELKSAMAMHGPKSPIVQGITEKMDEIDRGIRVARHVTVPEGGTSVSPLTGQPFATGTPKPPSPETITRLSDMTANIALGESVIGRFKKDPKIVPGITGRLAEKEVLWGIKPSELIGHISSPEQRAWHADAADFIGVYRMARAGLNVTRPELVAAAPTVPFEGVPNLQQLESVLRWTRSNKEALEQALITFHRMSPIQQEQLLKRAAAPAAPLTPPSPGPSPLHQKIRARDKRTGQDVNIYLPPGVALPSHYEAIK